MSGLLIVAAGSAQAVELVANGVVSTASLEIRATVSPDGRRIAWGSPDREGGPGGWDLWWARLERGAWVDPVPLTIDTPSKEFDPLFSADGRWLYFFSDRPGGLGGDDLYRVAVRADGALGDPENLGPGVNSAGNEWAPTPARDGQHLLFASDGHGGAGRHDLFEARWDGGRFVDPRPLLGVNTGEDEFDAAWLADGRGLLFARSPNADEDPIRLWTASCDGRSYAGAEPWDSPLNAADGWTLGPVLEGRHRVLVSGIDPDNRAGKLDIYRVQTPDVDGRPGCVGATE